MKGRGKIKGWITKNGVHIPIYENYTVRKGVEPEEVKARFKSNKAKSKQDRQQAMRNEIEKDIKSKMETHWKWAGDDKERFATSDTKRMMEKVDTILDHFKDKNMIEPSKDYDREIVWRFSGKDRQTGKHAGFEFDSYPRESDARETLSGNGYNVSNGLILPKPMFNYLMDYTNVTDSDIAAAKAVMKAALKEYKGNKGIRRGKK